MTTKPAFVTLIVSLACVDSFEDAAFLLKEWMELRHVTMEFDPEKCEAVCRIRFDTREAAEAVAQSIEDRAFDQLDGPCDYA